MLQTIQTWFQRIAAVDTAGRKLDAAQRHALLADLTSGYAARCLHAMRTLIETGAGRDEITALGDLLDAADPIVRSEAALTLAALDSSASRAVLLKAASSPKSAVQAAAADGLGAMPTRDDSVEALVVLLLSRDSAVRQSAGEALARMAPLPATKDGMPAAPHVQVTLLKLLNSDKTPMVRRAAALGLAKWGDAEVEKALVTHRDDKREDWRVRDAATAAIARRAALAPPSP